MSFRADASGFVVACTNGLSMEYRFGELSNLIPAAISSAFAALKLSHNDCNQPLPSRASAMALLQRKKHLVFVKLAT